MASQLAFVVGPSSVYAHPTMRFAFPTNNSRRIVFRLLALTLLFSAAPKIFAQYGVSPSQTGLFFDDLRGRAASRTGQNSPNAQSGASLSNTEGSYNYTADGYSGVPSTSSSPTEDAGSIMQEATEQIGRPRTSTGYSMYSLRQAGDYTQYSGPYPTSTTFFAPAFTSDSQLSGHRNLQYGPLSMGFGVSNLLEYDDNINRSHDHKEGAAIDSFYLNLSANYQVTETSALQLSTAVGFDHYFEHANLSPYGKNFVLNVLPGSSISFDGKIGDAYVVVYDRMSVRPATPTNFALNSTNVFGIFQNDAGIATEIPLSPELNLSFNYMRSDSFALEKIDDIFNRSMDSVHTSLAYCPDGITTYGVEGGYSWIYYPNGFNSNGTTANGGVFYTTPLGQSTSIRVATGVQDFEFDKRPAGSARIDSDSLTTPYYNVTLSNRLTPRLSQAVNFGYEAALNTTSNYTKANYVSYGLGIIAWEGSRLSISGYYEDAHESGGVPGRVATFDGTEKQNLEQYGVDVYLSHQLTSRIRAGVGYHYGIANSNLIDGDYTQQSVSFDINYALSRKLSASLGYRYFLTDAQLLLASFNQNRFIMSMNYNF